VIGASTVVASTPLAVSTSNASMLSSLSGRLAATARVHDDHRQFAANLARNDHRSGSAVSGTCRGAVGLSSDRRP
jgi:hypothetical protein